MKTSMQITILFSLMGLALEVTAQAPGDHDSFCRSGNFAPSHDFPQEWETLVDTFDYVNLLGRGGAWSSTSQDSDTDHFRQNIGGLCGWSPFICTNRPAQNNWLFSQYVSFTEAKEIFFNMSYSFVQCPRCQDDYITLSRYDVNGIVSEGERTNTANYQPMFGTSETSRLSATREETRSLIRPEPNTKGFYMGFHDAGTCGQITRIIAYYTVCRARQIGLVKYPQFATPPRSGPNEVFSAMCAANAHSVTSLEVTALSASSTCVDVAPGGARCECDAGYELSADGRACIPCKAGEYRALGGSQECQPCPANTQTDVVAAAQCECLPGMFRSILPGKEEGPEANCTAPPSEVRDLEIEDSDSTAILVSWGRPLTTGKNLYYEVLLSESFSITASSVPVESFLQDNRKVVDYMVSGLKPFTNYVITVVTHNAVSDQDEQNDDRRRIQVVGRTTEGVPGMPSLNRLCTVLIWKPPTQPAGVILGYEVRFGQSSEKNLTFGPDESFYITSGEERAQNALVEIRARNSFASSPWTEPLPLDCSSMTGCPGTTPLPDTDSTNNGAGAVACGSLVAPSHGMVSVNDGEAAYSCEEGFALSGDQSRMCQADGSWTGEAPTCEPLCKSQPLYFMLKGERHENNSVIPLEELGRDNDALLAITGNQDCCRSRRIGEFFYPDGSLVPINNAGQALYRNRDSQLIRLHLRDQASSASIPRGKYHCELPDDCGEMVSLYVNLV